MPGLQLCTTMFNLCGAGDRTQGSVHTRQALYQLSYVLSPLSSPYPGPGSGPDSSHLGSLHGPRAGFHLHCPARPTCFRLQPSALESSGLGAGGCARVPLSSKIEAGPPYALPVSGNSVLPGWRGVTGQPSRSDMVTTDLFSAVAPARQDHKFREAPTLKRSWLLAWPSGLQHRS